MAEHNCPFFLPQRFSKLSTSTSTVQCECELKSAPICSPRRQFGAKLCEYVPFSCSGHGRLVTTCHHAMLRTERERFDQRFVARHGSIAPAPTKKYVKHQAFKKKLSNMCPQVRSTGIGHKTSSFSRPRCLRQGLHCTQEEGPQSLHVVCSPRAKQVSIFCRTLLSQ